jgi:hypothetical protein
MRPGDMDQLDDKAFDDEIRAVAVMGAALLALLLMATGVGVFFGWLIWGI